jgi:hypothetical protein
MTSIDTRQINRDSLFLMANVRLDGEPVESSHRVKVRNLSSGGMMAEGDMKVMRGALVNVELRNIGWIDGSVAWKQDNRFGIAFTSEIDPKIVRSAPVDDDNEGHTPRFLRSEALRGGPADPDRLRKI